MVFCAGNADGQCDVPSSVVGPASTSRPAPRRLVRRRDGEGPRVVVAACGQELFCRIHRRRRRLEPAPVDVAAGRGHGAGLCRDEREEAACVRRMYLMSMCSATVLWV